MKFSERTIKFVPFKKGVLFELRWGDKYIGIPIKFKKDYEPKVKSTDKDGVTLGSVFNMFEEAINVKNNNSNKKTTEEFN